MAKNANYVSHKKSKLKNQDGSPQLPSASALVEGEIAINFAENVETLSIKNESGHVVTFSSDNYYTEKKLGSGFTGANSAVTVTEALENAEIDVDQDFSNTASTNPISTKAVYSAVTDNELVWTNAFVELSSTTSAHTANTTIHVTAADKEKLHTHSNKSALDAITGNVGTMAYQNAASYSSATEVNTALGNKANTSDLADFFDDAKYEDSGTTKVINFYHGNAIKATIDASDFIVDGMVDDVRIENGNLVIDFNTASGKQDISIPLTDIFDPSNYYDKDDIDDLVGSGFTSSSITDVIIENEEIVSAALTDLDDRKLDATAYTPTDLSNYYTKPETSGATEISNALGGKVNTSDIGETIHYLTGMTGNAGGENLAAKWFGNASEITELYTGLCVRFIIPSAGHASGDTLSINDGELHPIYYNATTNLTTHYGAGTLLNLTYDANTTGNYYSGSSTQASVQGVWRANAEYYSDKNTDTIGYSVGFNTAVYKADAAAYRYMLLLTKDETTLTPVNTKSNTTASTKTLTTSEFDPFGNIIYKSSTTTIAAGVVIPSATTWTQYAMNLSYSFNTTNTLIANKAVYVVTVPQSNGKVKLHSSPISQTLPTSDDGLVYIYLGHAYNTTNIFLTTNHPVYQYKNGQLRQYVGSFGTMAYANTSSYSSATEVNTALGEKVNSATYTGHTADTTVHFTTGTVQTQIDNSISGKVNTSDIISAITPSNSGSTAPIATKVVAENELTVSNALNDLNANKADKSTTYTKTEIDDMIGDIESILATI